MGARGDGDEPADGVAEHPAAAGATAAWTSWAAVAIGRSAVTMPDRCGPPLTPNGFSWTGGTRLPHGSRGLGWDQCLGFLVAVEGRVLGEDHLVETL
jgi:hypothetical protein